MLELVRSVVTSEVNTIYGQRIQDQESMIQNLTKRVNILE